MGRVGQHLGINFVISVGDNFYQAGLKGPHDPKFKNSFTKVYTARSLQTQWFSGMNYAVSCNRVFCILHLIELPSLNEHLVCALFFFQQLCAINV